jgi:hypothetical protein
LHQILTLKNIEKFILSLVDMQRWPTTTLVRLLDHEQVSLGVARHDLVGGRTNPNLMFASFPIIAGVHGCDGQLSLRRWIWRTICVCEGRCAGRCACCPAAHQRYDRQSQD